MLSGYFVGPITMVVAWPAQKSTFMNSVSKLGILTSSKILPSPEVGEKITPVAVYYLQKCQK